MQPNRLYFGDCLEIMQEYIPDESVDLIYLDPPFNSKRIYNAFIDGAQWVAFNDTWQWHEAIDDFDRVAGLVKLGRKMEGLRLFLGDGPTLAYLSYMANRLWECRRVLKPNGSIYLHCDPTMSHFLKLVMDAVFGDKQFKNEIVWKRQSAHGRAKRWGPIHDVLLFYSRSDRHFWNRTFQEYDQEYIDNFFTHEDEYGRYRIGNFTGPGTRQGSSGLPWRGIDPTEKGRHWEIPPDRILPKHFKHPPRYSEMTVQERLDVLDEAGLVYWPPKGKVPQPKQYLNVSPGVALQDLVLDIPPLSAQAVTTQPRLGSCLKRNGHRLKRPIMTAGKRESFIYTP